MTKKNFRNKSSEDYSILGRQEEGPSSGPPFASDGGWDEMFTKQEFRWKRPLPCVEEFVGQLKEEHRRLVCDLGCGAGRHTVLLSRNGFEVLALDMSPRGLAHTQKWLRQENLNATTVLCKLPPIPLRTQSVDAVVATNVIHHDLRQSIGSTVAEIYRILSRDGLVLVTVLSKDDYRYRTGTEMEKDTFINCIGPEKGVLHHFFSGDELLGTFQQFTHVRSPLRIKSSYTYTDETGKEFVGDILLGIFRKSL